MKNKWLYRLLKAIKYVLKNVFSKYKWASILVVIIGFILSVWANLWDIIDALKEVFD